MIVFCKGFLFDRRRKFLSANFHFQPRPDPRGRGQDIPHSDADVQARRKRTAANFPNPCAVVQKRIVRARRRTFSIHLECDESLTCTVCFRFQQFFAPGEIWFLEIDEKAEPGLDRITFGGEIRTVERVTHFQSQSIARSQTARFCAEFGAAFQNKVQNFAASLARKNLHAIFTGVTGARDRNRHF